VRRLVIALAFLIPAIASAQRPIIARDGWEAFPFSQYIGGDATQPKPFKGIRYMLVLTDSAIAFHECVVYECLAQSDKVPFKPTPVFSIPLRQIKEIASSSQVRGAGFGAKLAVGMLAGDRTEEHVGIVYETETSAEAPVFQVDKTHANAIEAKVRFRLKKLGIELPGSVRQ
jgi:hypothetical protein